MKSSLQPAFKHAGASRHVPGLAKDGGNSVGSRATKIVRGLTNPLPHVALILPAILLTLLGCGSPKPART
jgi:hypothetical protein